MRQKYQKKSFMLPKEPIEIGDVNVDKIIISKLVKTKN